MIADDLIAGMAVEDEGGGEPVLMIHGLGGTSNSWQPVMGALSGMRVIRPDLPGTGRSPVPKGPIDVALIVSSLGLLADKLGLARVHVIGHSFGTLVAQHLAAARPELVRSLLLFGPIIEPADAGRERLRARAALARSKGMALVANQVTPAGLAAGSADVASAAFAFVRESHMRQDSDGFAKSCEALAGATRADAAAIACPTMVVTGDEDAIGPPGVAYQLGEELRRAQVRILAGCGHWTPLEKPAECRDVIRAFLREGMNF
jgi:pimeloyl-ACP methyl ester carboxylesterase